MPKKPGFIALDVSVEFMRAADQFATNTHQKISTFVPRLPCKPDNFNVEHTCIHLVLSMKIATVILCRVTVTLWRGREGGLKLNVTMTLWFPQIVWTSPLMLLVTGSSQLTINSKDEKNLL